MDNYYKTQKDKFLTSLKEIVGDKNDEIINILNTRIDNLKFDDENLQRTFLELKDVYEKLKNK
ncbi:MAG: hypothetical protein LBU14_00800 [Candidatus Peribacteria bacterium]|nr:hypothetical protein [Candidatus Peribacteria bacterium]